MSRPWMFFAQPLRDHWANKHRMDANTGKIQGKTKMEKKETEKAKAKEAVFNSLAIFSADANMPTSACEKKTLYSFAEKLHELYVKAGPSTKFCELFPDEKICGRKKLGNRLISISSKLQELLW